MASRRNIRAHSRPDAPVERRKRPPSTYRPYTPMKPPVTASTERHTATLMPICRACRTTDGRLIYEHARQTFLCPPCISKGTR